MGVSVRTNENRQSGEKRRLLNISNGKKKRSNESKKAILIGLNYTGTRYALNGCINDANRMKKTLVCNFGYDNANVSVLTDKNLNVHNNILEILSDLIRSGAKNLFFQYSGHGTQQKDNNFDERDGLDEALYSVNGTIITDDQINDVVRTVPKGTSLVFVIDACHSGTIIDLPFQLIGSEAIRVSNNEVDGDIICITGCRDEQVSMDITAGATSYGAMSNALQAVLKRCDPNTITWRQLIDLLNADLRKEKMAQVPQLCVSRVELLDRFVSI